ncbi:Protein of unknown function DUF1764, eukaryotic [Plasmopara halstedii]|uniref:DUF1764-domain-containing protein n=1 Tax=Plasmopara halstedii TaxID=4781 RepID=A0A0P1B5W0_PLAHL|nr:Protein of unknown function DUF1764, eukaryotic [Plasmopara halstedii]CEG49639.1 Protein of unknown function DUF1764, eukaryotic [Plasmopara halstedii]|eukprot:XP_024586008.1 Protein of unknown function DUF1764, eukaryotic [Plasmopara halstedii]
MANKKKREAVASPVSSQQTTKKKTKHVFAKTLTIDAKTAGLKDRISEDVKKVSTDRTLTDHSSLEAAKVKKKAKKKTRKKADDTAMTKKNAKIEANSAEIDDLFAILKTKKRKKNIAEENQKLAKEVKERCEKKERERLQQQIKKLEAQNTNSTACGLNPDPRPVRYDEDGLPIYTEAALQIGKGGNTQDCPFDCWCCF